MWRKRERGEVRERGEEDGGDEVEGKEYKRRGIQECIGRSNDENLPLIEVIIINKTG